MTFLELEQRVLELSTKIDMVDKYVQFNITTAFTVLGIAIAISGVALVFLARIWSLKHINEKAVEMENNIKGSLLKEMPSRYLVHRVTVAAGSTVRFPILLNTEQDPILFSSVHRGNSFNEYVEISITVDGKEVILNNPFDTDVSVDLLIMDASSIQSVQR